MTGKEAALPRSGIDESAAGGAKDDAWYERWFGEEYLHLYPHRDEEEAARAVALLLREIVLEEGSRILDLACGAGRHLRALASHGLRGTGLDLSMPLLGKSREEGTSAALVRGDIRHLPFAPGSFDAVSSFFTSFGYFPSEAEDRRVLEEVRRVLAPGGHFFLDFLNAHRVRDTLRPRDAREIGGRRVLEERRILAGGHAVEKTIRIEGEEGEEANVFIERVRLYSPEELQAAVRSTGFRIEAIFGDYRGSPLERLSPRVILVGSRA